MKAKDCVLSNFKTTFISPKITLPAFTPNVQSHLQIVPNSPKHSIFLLLAVLGIGSSEAQNCQTEAWNKIVVDLTDSLHWVLRLHRPWSVGQEAYTGEKELLKKRQLQTGGHHPGHYFPNARAAPHPDQIPLCRERFGNGCSTCRLLPGKPGAPQPKPEIPLYPSKGLPRRT